MRRDVSFLLDHGHPDAADYPICVLWAEVRLAKERVDGYLASQMVLTQLAIASMFVPESGKTFVESIERLTE